MTNKKESKAAATTATASEEVPMTANATTADFDSKEGIASYLARGLAGLRDLIEARASHYCKTNEMMSEFWVLGKFLLHKRGQTRCPRPFNFPEEKILDGTIPEVITVEEFSDLSKVHGVLVPPGEYQQNSMVNLPPQNYKDPISGEGWTLDNCHDVVGMETRERQEPLELEPYVGMTLHEVQEALDLTEGPVHYTLWVNTLANPAKVDLTVRPINPKRKYKRQRPVNENGLYWQYTKVQYDEMLTHVVQPGDTVCVHTYRYYHGETHRQLEEQKHYAQRKVQVIETGAMLKFMQFSKVQVEEGDLPDYFLRQVRKELGEEEEGVDEAIALGFQYLNVESMQGKFGIIFGGQFPFLLDLKPAGLTVQDLQRAQFAGEIGQGGEGDPEEAALLAAMIANGEIDMEVMNGDPIYIIPVCDPELTPLRVLHQTLSNRRLQELTAQQTQPQA